MKNPTNEGPKGRSPLTKVSELRRTVATLQAMRSAARLGDPARSRELDGALATQRQLLADALLEASMVRRDAGDHDGALELAREYAEQEHLARTLRERQADGSGAPHQQIDLAPLRMPTSGFVVFYAADGSTLRCEAHTCPSTGNRWLTEAEGRWVYPAKAPGGGWSVLTPSKPMALELLGDVVTFQVVEEVQR